VSPPFPVGSYRDSKRLVALHQPSHLVRLVLAHALGYLKWTQTLPMIMGWAMVWTVLAAFLLVNFQSEAFTILEASERFLDRYPWIVALLPAVDEFGTTDAEGRLYFDGDDIRGVVLAYWGLLSAVLYIGALIIGQFRPPRPPSGLGSRLRIAGFMSAGTFLTFLVAYVISSEPYHGGPAGWVLLFAALSILPLAVSLYALTVGWICDSAAHVLTDGGSDTGPDDPGAPRTG